MSVVFWTILVGVVGWGLSFTMRTGTGSENHVLHLLIGISGALLGGWLMATPHKFNMAQAGEVSFLSLLVSFVIALSLSMIANLWDRVTSQEESELDF